MIRTARTVTKAQKAELELRQKLLKWVNETLNTKLVRVEDMCTGAAYCQLMDLLFPHSMPMHRVRFYTNIEYDYIYNYKLLEVSFDRLNIHKAIPISKLIKARPRDNLSFMQWFKSFFDNYNNGKAYDPLKARKGSLLGIGPKAKGKPPPNRKSNTDSDAESYVFENEYDDITPEVLMIADESLDLKKRFSLLLKQLRAIRVRLFQTEQTRDEYNKRLLDVYMICRMAFKSTAVTAIQQILRPHNEQFEEIFDNIKANNEIDIIQSLLRNPNKE